MKQDEIFRILKNEWDPEGKPSPAFIQAMNQLLEMAEQEQLYNPTMLILDSFNNIERQVSNILGEQREQLHRTIEES